MTSLFIIVLILAIIFAIAFFNSKATLKNSKASFLKSYNGLQNLYRDTHRQLSEVLVANKTMTAEIKTLKEAAEEHSKNCPCNKTPEEVVPTLEVEGVPIPEADIAIVDEQPVAPPAPVTVKSRPRVARRYVKK